MAVTFRGSLCTNSFNPIDGCNILVIDVSARSRCTVKILKLGCEVDTYYPSVVAGKTMPMIRVQKFVGTATGGYVLTNKVPFDTTINSPDSGIRFRVCSGLVDTSNITLTGTPVTMWQDYTIRQCTGAEQFLSDTHGFTTESGSVLVRPGELLAVKWIEGTVTAGGSVFLKVAWEEDQTDAGYTVSGTVTLSGVPVTGAKVALLTDLDRDMPEPEVEIITTGAPGTWSKTLATGVDAAASVQYRVGEVLYTDEGKPYLTST